MGMDPVTIAAVGSLIFGASQTVMSYKAGQDKEDAIEAETARKKALQTKENEKTLATARARAAASGTSGVTEQVLLQDLAASGLEELEWLNTVGAFESEAASTETALAVTKSSQKTFSAGLDVYNAFSA